MFGNKTKLVSVRVDEERYKKVIEHMGKLNADKDLRGRAWGAQTFSRLVDDALRKYLDENNIHVKSF